MFKPHGATPSLADVAVTGSGSMTVAGDWYGYENANPTDTAPHCETDVDVVDGAGNAGPVDGLDTAEA